MRTWILSMIGVVVSLSSCVDMRETYRARVNAQFPLDVGCVWTYAYCDSLSGTTDTLTVSVISVHGMNDGSFQYDWRFTSGAQTTMCPVILIGTTVRFPRTPFGPSEGMAIAFPLEDSHRPSGNVIVPAGSFPTTYLTEHTSSIPNTYSHFRYWISPGVGIVRVRTRIFESLSGKRGLELFELISYKISM